MTSARLTVVTGKGGVGRSTIAAALTDQAAACGQRVLAIDASGGEGLALALGCYREPTPGQPVMVSGPGSATVLVLDTEAALDEYVRIQLPTPISPRSLGPVARIFEYVANAAPAVREILTIGKIGHEVRNGAWDLVVVDGPATGHIVELLAAPATLGDLVGIGPLANETAWLTDLLADPTITGIVAVSTAEELPVTETLELLARLTTRTGVAVSGLVVNRWPPTISGIGAYEARDLVDRNAPNAGLAAAAVARAEMATAERERLAPLDLPLLTVPDSTEPVAAALAALTEAGW